MSVSAPSANPQRPPRLKSFVLVLGSGREAKKEQSELCSFVKPIVSSSAVGAHPLFTERRQRRIHRRMNFQNRVQVRQLQQPADQWIWSCTLQTYVLSLGPGLQQGQFPNPGAVNRTHATQVEHQLPRL